MEVRNHEFFVPSSVSLVAPAVRMVVVEAWACLEGGKMTVGHQIIPVVAIAAVVGCRWQHVRYLSGVTRIDGTDKQLRDAGWEQDSPTLRISPVVAGEEQYSAPSLDLADESWVPGNVFSRVFAAPWDADADEVRLADEIERLRSAVAAHCDRSRKMEVE